MAVKTQDAGLMKPKTRFTEFEDVQERLPYWARSTNPIVRRHLGLYWRTVPPELQPFGAIFLVWVVVMVSGILLPALFGFTMISFLASIMIIPFALILYAHVLWTISTEASDHMQQEFSNDTFQLLQATPMSLSQIFLGKVAAAIWHRMDDLVMIAQLMLAFSPPILFYIYAQIWPTDVYGFAITPIMALLATVVVLARLVLEPLMIGVLSVFIGIVVPGKGRAISASVVLGAFYFLLLNLLSQLPSVRGFETSDGLVPPNVPLVLLTDFVLPVALPLLLIFGLLKLSAWLVTKD
jgi:hypothetical protein